MILVIVRYQFDVYICAWLYMPRDIYLGLDVNYLSTKVSY